MGTEKEFIDVAWLLVCAALVMLMQAGFSCLESGMVRSKNSINVAAKNFADFCVSGAVFWVFGFAVMFGATYGGIFGTSGFFFGEAATPWLFAFFIFQMGFCGTATTIVSGAVSERMRFSGYLLVAVILSGLIYPVIGHWVWGSAAGVKPGGWLEQMGFIDFAGSTVVHSVGGWMSLAAIIIIGPRIGRFGKDRVPIQGHDLPFVTLGVFLLWFGWFGFNGGSTLGLTPDVPKIIFNTTISGSFGGLVALALAWRLGGRPDVTMIMNGSLAGLVGITASANIMTPLAAVGIGCIAAVVMYGATMLLERFELDDVVGAVPVHLAAGIWGTLAVAIFADPQSWGSGLGRWDQFVVQATGVGATFVWAFGVGFALLWLINRRFPLRIDPEGERIGLNVAEHGASTEILDLLNAMEKQRQANDFSQPIAVEPHTEIGQIAQQYNHVLADINAEHKRLEATTKALKQQTESLQLLQETAAAANRAKSIEEAVQTCLDGICVFGGWPIGHCYLVDDDVKRLISAGIWHLDDEERYAAFREVTEIIDIVPGGALSSRVLTGGKPIWVADVSKEKKFYRARAAKDVGIKGAAAFPVLVGEDVVAVLEFFSPEPLEPNEAILEVMASVGAQLGRVVERARSAEARFKTMVDNMPANVHLRNKYGQFILVNRKYEEFYGVANDLVQGKTLHEINGNQVFDQIIKEAAETDREVIEKNTVIEHEFKVMSDDGYRTLTERYFPIADSSGEVIEVGSIEIDITDLKRTEEALAEKSAMLEVTMEHMDQGISMFDGDLKLTAFNHEFVDLLEFPSDLVHPGTSLAELFHYNAERGEYGPGDPDEQVTERIALARKFEAHHFERTRPDGLVMEIRGKPITGGGFVTTYADITDRKRAETTLRENEERFRDFSEAASDWFWEMDENLRFTYFSDQFTEISGVANEDLIGKTRQKSGLDLKDDKIRRNIADLEGHRPFKDFEHSRTLANGNVVYMSTRGKPVFDADDNFKGYRGTGSDITERKRAEKALSDQLKFTEELVDTIPNPILVKDPECRYVTFNRAYEEAFDVKREDYIGKTVLELEHLPLELREHLHKEDSELLRTGGKVHRETARPYADGKEHDLLYWQNAFELTDGNIGGLVGVLVDISEQKHLERELAKSKERMQDELNIGREIQMSMVPLIFPPFPDHDEFSIYATLEPAREVGGDFYDFYFIDEERLCICIGDVSGKGVPSALFMAMAKTLIKSRAADDASTASILTHVNDELSTDNKTCMFVTIFAGILNIRTGELIYTNAGHNPPYLRRKDGHWQRLDRRHGPVIGAVEGMVYKEERDTMEPGDLLFLYSDGVTEAMDSKKRLFSEDRLKDLLHAGNTDDAVAVVDNTLAAVRAFEGGTEQSDDITVLGLEFHGGSEEAPVVEQKIVIKNHLSEIAVVNEKFGAFAEEFGIPVPVSSKFKLIFDDLLNNVISYAYRDDDEHDIEVRIELAGERLTVTISDDGVPFNPLNVETPDTGQSLEDRDGGGLGILLIRSLVDDVSYQRRIDKNIMTMVKHL